MVQGALAGRGPLHEVLDAITRARDVLTAAVVALRLREPDDDQRTEMVPAQGLTDLQVHRPAACRYRWGSPASP